MRYTYLDTHPICYTHIKGTDLKPMDTREEPYSARTGIVHSRKQCGFTNTTF